jgi:hypothetical protein
MNTCILTPAFAHREEDAPSQPARICDHHSGKSMLRRNVSGAETKSINCTQKIQRAQMLDRKYFVTRRDVTVPCMTLRER